jgi:UDP-glucuronate 4-epimerase
VEGTGLILERMRSVGVRRLAFASSSSVYGIRPATTDAFDEREPCITPASPYAASKRMNELQLSTYHDLFGLGAFALRYFTVYGPRQRPEMAIAKFVRAISQQEEITLYGDGGSRRDYTFIDDIVTGTIAAIETVEPGRFEILNLGGTQTTSLVELVRTIEGIVGATARIRWEPDQPGDVPITFANVARAHAVLGYKPTTKIEDGVARYWEWVQLQ